MNQPVLNNWLQVEDQLTKKLSQLTMLLEHFATSNEDELLEVCQTKKLHSILQIIVISFVNDINILCTLIESFVDLNILG